LGHWKNGDIYITIGSDMVYMALLAFFFKFCLNNPAFLTQFGFTHESLFISVYLFYKVYSVTIDYPIRKIYHILGRFYETRADNYAKDLNYGGALRSALLRNYSENNEALFIDPLYAKMMKTHPTLLERMENLAEFK
jgi:STE24 endopeptidase